MGDPFAFSAGGRPGGGRPGGPASDPFTSWPGAASSTAGGLPQPGSMGTMGAPSSAPSWASFGQPGAAGGQPSFGQPSLNPASLAEMANNPMAQLGMKYGREIVESSLQRYMPGASGFWNSMRYYFHINNSYVKNKLRKVLFPFMSRNFVRVLAAEAGMASGGGMGGSHDNFIAGPAMAGVSPYAAPVHDENAPDLYIPLMAFITFVLMTGLLQGTKMQFTPEVLVNVTSQSLVTTVLEVVALKAGMYVLSGEGCPMLDLVCYAGYKYVGLCINMLVGLLGGRTAYFVAFAYTATATAFFIINTLMPVVRPENFRAGHASAHLPGGAGRVAAAQKNYLVLAAGAAQYLLLWWLGPKV